VRVLFLSQRVPYPPNRGDKITTWRLVERLKRAHEVRVIAFAHGPEDEHGARELRALRIEVQTVPLDARAARLRALPLVLTRRPLTLGWYGSRALQALVDRAARESDLAYAYSSSMGAFLLPHAPRLPFVMHMAELDSDKWRQYAERGRPPLSWIHAREARTLLAFERQLAAQAVTCVFCTALEEAIFRRHVPGRPSLVLRNGVDLRHFTPLPERSEPGHLVFTGVMDYFPNADACDWLARRILPRVRERFPAARLSIVGANPTAAVRALGRLPNVTVTGSVPSTVEWLARASVAVAPLRIARGVQNKVLEAFAMGLPVVATTPATQGIEARAGEHFLLADDAPAQVEALCGLLGDPVRAGAIGRRARALVEQRYDWEDCLAPLDALVRDAARTRPAPRTTAAP
jgi:sugar transferase (PEP-CTERM/EpsH1 system associated)